MRSSARQTNHTAVGGEMRHASQLRYGEEIAPSELPATDGSPGPTQASTSQMIPPVMEGEGGDQAMGLGAKLAALELGGAAGVGSPDPVVDCHLKTLRGRLL